MHVRFSDSRFGISDLASSRLDLRAASSIANRLFRNCNFFMIYRRVLRYYRPFLWPTVAGLLLSLVGIGVNLLKPWPFKFIVDQILPANSTFRANTRTGDAHSPALPGAHRAAARLGIDQSLDELSLR